MTDPLTEGSLPPLAKWARGLTIPALQSALAAAADPSVLTMSLGLPDPSLFPVDDLANAAARVLASNSRALQYSMPCDQLKIQVCEHMARRGVACSPEEVFLTSGATQGLALLVALLLDSKGVVVEEELSYPTFRQALEPYSPRILCVPTSSSTGVDIEALEHAIRRVRPAFFYCITDGHNPLGLSLSLESRQRLVAIARQLRIPIIEDDAYGHLSYTDAALPPLRGLEPEWIYYVGSFSKVLAPSLRIGWLVVPPSLMQPLSVIKEGYDINMGTLGQWVAAEYLDSGRFPAHVDGVRSAYRKRRDVMSSALEMLPEQCRWRIPTCGLFFWIDLPDRVDGTELLRVALERERVAFLPAEIFSRGRRKNGLRLSFGCCDPASIHEGVARIARVLTPYVLEEPMRQTAAQTGGRRRSNVRQVLGRGSLDRGQADL
jgi:2-aminoadipate transaminase